MINGFFNLKDLEQIGVLTPVQKSEFYTPILKILRKQETLIFIMYCQRFNRQLVQNTHPISRIGEIIYQL